MIENDLFYFKERKSRLETFQNFIKDINLDDDIKKSILLRLVQEIEICEIEIEQITSDLQKIKLRTTN